MRVMSSTAVSGPPIMPQVMCRASVGRDPSGLVYTKRDGAGGRC